MKYWYQGCFFLLRQSHCRILSQVFCLIRWHNMALTTEHGCSPLSRCNIKKRRFTENVASVWNQDERWWQSMIENRCLEEDWNKKLQKEPKWVYEVGRRTSTIRYTRFKITSRVDFGRKEGEKIKRVRLFRLSTEESFNLGGRKQIREKKKAAIT